MQGLEGVEKKMETITIWVVQGLLYGSIPSFLAVIKANQHLTGIVLSQGAQTLND